MTASSLRSLLGAQVLGVASSYQQQQLSAAVCGVFVHPHNQLHCAFPKGHALQAGDLLTVHLDNRTGVSDYDADLSVYRCSYKGQVQQVMHDLVLLQPLQFSVFYGNRQVLEYQAPGYSYPPDERPVKAIAQTPLTALPQIDAAEHDNKVGVLITKAQQQPHTTVMAFLSSAQDDIFFITFANTFKAQLLARDPNCIFAIDSRADFTFVQAIDWNYSLVCGEVCLIPRQHPLFVPVKELFIAKNPWEVGFFDHPAVEMYHIRPKARLANQAG